MNTYSAIGVFDSGIGGLSVLKEIRQALPGENLVYIADTAFAPYGDRQHEEIINRCEYLLGFLQRQGIKMLVVACNTATAVAVNSLRQRHNLPIVAMEPGVKPAVENSVTGKVGIMATTMTLSSQRYTHLLEKFAVQTDVVEQACPGLVEQVENLQIDAPETKKLLEQYLKPFIREKVDSIVLGCTHYPFLKKMIREICGKEIKIIDTGQAVTREVGRRLELSGMKNSTDHDGDEKFFTTGLLELFNRQLACYWASSVKGQVVKP